MSSIARVPDLSVTSRHSNLTPLVYQNLVPKCKLLLDRVTSKIQSIYQAIMLWFNELYSRFIVADLSPTSSVKGLLPHFFKELDPSSSLSKMESFRMGREPAPFDKEALFGIHLPYQYKKMLAALYQQDPQGNPIDHALTAYEKLASPLEEVSKVEKLMGLAATVHFLSLPAVAATAIGNYGIKKGSTYKALTCIGEITALSGASSLLIGYSPTLGYSLTGLAWLSSIVGVTTQESLTAGAYKWIQTHSPVSGLEIEQVKAIMPYAPAGYASLHNKVVGGHANQYELKKLVKVAASMYPHLSQGMLLEDQKKKMMATKLIASASSAACVLMVTQIMTDNLLIQASHTALCFALRYSMPSVFQSSEKYLVDSSQLALSKLGSQVGIQQTLALVGATKQIAYIASFVFQQQAIESLSTTVMMLGSIGYHPVKRALEDWNSLSQQHIVFEAHGKGAKGEKLAHTKKEKAQLQALKAHVVAQGLFSIGVRGAIFYATDSLVSSVTGMPMAGHIAGSTASLMAGKLADKAWDKVCLVSGGVKNLFFKVNPWSSHAGAALSQAKIQKID